MLTKPKHGAPETRTTVSANLRADDAKFQISGIAASYNTLSANLGGFKEKIAPGAFSRSLRTGADCKCLFNHDASKICGRVGNGTLVLSDSPEGLRFVCQLDRANPEHAAYYASIKRRDIVSCSFAFTVPDSSCESWQDADGTDNVFAIRTLLDVDLLDASFVTYPAYPVGTSVDARAAAVAADRHADEIRRRRVAIVGQLVDEDRRAMDQSEVSAMEDWASARLSEHFAKLGKGWRVVHFNDKHVYAMPVDSLDADDSDCAAMSKCSRFVYGIDDKGDVTLSDQQRAADYPEEEDPDGPDENSARFQAVVAELRDRSLWKRRMRATAGIFTR
jgi:Escherichia/Staphylococcus phage prohead protease